MKSVCAWCEKSLPPVIDGRRRINFGICEDCLPAWREEMQVVVAAHQPPKGERQWS